LLDKNVFTWNNGELASIPADTGPTSATACCRANSFPESMLRQLEIDVTLRLALKAHVSLLKPVYDINTSVITILEFFFIAHVLVNFMRLNV